MLIKETEKTSENMEIYVILKTRIINIVKINSMKNDLQIKCNVKFWNSITKSKTEKNKKITKIKNDQKI